MDTMLFMNNRHSFIYENLLPEQKPQPQQDCEYARDTQTWE